MTYKEKIKIFEIYIYVNDDYSRLCFKIAPTTEFIRLIKTRKNIAFMIIEDIETFILSERPLSQIYEQLSQSYHAKNE